jgi:D-galacturonate reductase
MKYTPDPKGRFAGQLGYGYRSIEAFIDAVAEINESPASTSGASFDAELPTVGNTMLTTAILEAGRRSLDHANGSGTPISIVFKGSEGEEWDTPVGYA